MVYSHWIEWCIAWTEPNQVNRLKHGRTCVVKPHAMQKETCMRIRFNCVSAKLQLLLDTICALKMPKRSARCTDEVTLELTEEFRNHPELWKVKSSAYFRYDFSQRLWWYPSREFQILELSVCCHQSFLGRYCRAHHGIVLDYVRGHCSEQLTGSCFTHSQVVLEIFGIVFLQYAQKSHIRVPISFLQPRLAPESSTFPYFIRLFFNC